MPNLGLTIESVKDLLLELSRHPPKIYKPLMICPCLACIVQYPTTREMVRLAQRGTGISYNTLSLVLETKLGAVTKDKEILAPR